ncbi:MAG: lysophospholipid acyltransferase family protein [Pseudomonadota bacterium]
MTPTWHSDDAPEFRPISIIGWLLVVVRAVLIMLTFAVGVGATLLLRIVERPLFGIPRPMTSPITQMTFRTSLAIMGLRIKTSGTPINTDGAVVSNHCSWLDILVLNSPQKVVFVSKAEVSGWPGVGFLARLVGTIFIQRDRKQAKAQQNLLREALRSGRKLLFFPEGTSTDGLRVLPFKSTLFSAFFGDGAVPVKRVQPVTLRYVAPEGLDARFYGWWGDMDLGPHALQILSHLRQGHAHIFYHEPLNVADYQDRKALALALHEAVQSGMS